MNQVARIQALLNQPFNPNRATGHQANKQMKPFFVGIRKILLALVLYGVLPGAQYVSAQTDTYEYGIQAELSHETEIEYGVMGYSSTPRSDAVARLQASDISGLQFQPARGYLDSLLQALAINPASQLLVFSRTSLNIANIKPQTPRAIYFNDETYVAWVPDSGVIEIASMDPKLGPVFYTLSQNQQTGAKFEHEVSQCLRCHDSYSMTGGGVPRFILGSGYTGANGNLVSHEGWILTDPSTPLQNRWGGWYVSGMHGQQVHLGNIAVNNPADLYQLEKLRTGNIETLDLLLDTRPYLTSYSDIVALMVIEHQVHIQNLITRVNYDVHTALHDTPEFTSATIPENTDIPEPVRRLVEDINEPLVEAMLMTNEVVLSDSITGSSGFREWFESQGPHDSLQRTLRELDLQTRLFRYPLSYQIYSSAFDHLPWPARRQIYLRLAEILTSAENTDGFSHLSGDDRTAILEILHETRPEFTALTGKP